MDKILHKEELVQLLKQAGVPNDLIEKVYQRLERSFIAFFLANAFVELPEDVRRELTFGMNQKDAAAMQGFVDRFWKYLNDHPECIDRAAVADKSERMMQEGFASFVKKTVDDLRAQKGV